MGVLKEMAEKGMIEYLCSSRKSIYTNITTFLGIAKFKIGRGAQGQEGYVKIISHHDGLYSLWVTISPSLRTVWFYDEFSCGDMVNEGEAVYTKPELNIYEYIDWLDDKIQRYIQE